MVVQPAAHTKLVEEAEATATVWEKVEVPATVRAAAREVLFDLLKDEHGLHD